MPLLRFAAPSLIALAAFTLGGCASGPPAPKPWAEVATRELNLALASVEVQGRRVAVTRSATATGPLPVVVYLPGIGQGADAGQRWAASWAQAGYTVLTVQPLEADTAAWRSELARTGEFRALGELHYGDAMRAERQAALRQLLTALQRTAVPGATLDWQRAAIAGYEVGAQAALAWATEPGAAWRPRAVIAISPPPMDATTGVPPALLITSRNDGDALGLVKQPDERRRAFQTMAPGAGWLLVLPAASHAALSGTLAPDGWHEQDQRRGGESMGRGGGGMRGGNGGPSGPMGGAPRGPRSGSATEAAQADLYDALWLSTAFLEAHLRGTAMPESPLLQAR